MCFTCFTPFSAHPSHFAPYKELSVREKYDGGRDLMVCVCVGWGGQHVFEPGQRSMQVIFVHCNVVSWVCILKCFLLLLIFYYCLVFFLLLLFFIIIIFLCSI